MTLTFHWFLPTTGDGRLIMGRGTACPRPPRLAPRPAPGRPAHPGGRSAGTAAGHRVPGPGGPVR